MFTLQARQRVGGDNDVGVFDLLRNRRSSARGRFIHGAHTQMRRKSAGLIGPDADNGRRRDDKHWGSFTRRLLHMKGGHGREDLNGLAQAHIIGQDSTDSPRQPCRQPRVPTPLVRAQDLAQARHRRQPIVPRATAQRSDACSPGVAQPHVVGCGGDQIDHADLHGSEPHVLTIPARQRPCFLQEGGQRTNAFPVQAHPHATHLDIVLTAG